MTKAEIDSLDSEFKTGMLDEDAFKSMLINDAAMLHPDIDTMDLENMALIQLKSLATEIYSRELNDVRKIDNTGMAGFSGGKPSDKAEAPGVSDKDGNEQGFKQGNQEFGPGSRGGDQTGLDRGNEQNSPAGKGDQQQSNSSRDQDNKESKGGEGNQDKSQSQDNGKDKSQSQSKDGKDQSKSQDQKQKQKSKGGGGGGQAWMTYQIVPGWVMGLGDFNNDENKEDETTHES